MTTQEVKSVTEKAYNDVRQKQNWSLQCLYGSAFLVGAIIIYSLLPNQWQCLDDTVVFSINMLQVLALVFYHGFALWADIIHYAAGKKHFPDLLDNAYGTSLTSEHSENYYASEQVKEGSAKLAWNVTENCYFTVSLYKMMKWKVVRKSLFFIVLFVIAIVLNQNDWIVTVLRLTIPIVFIKKAVVFCYALKEFEVQYESAYNVMTHAPSSNKQLLVDSINILLRYETLKAWLNVPTDNDIYKQERERLNKEFANISQNFKLRK